MDRIVLLGLSDIEKIKTTDMRKMVRDLVKQVNTIIYENGTNVDMNKNYFLRDFHDTRKGGVTSNIRSEMLNKKQAQRLYNELAQFINADIESTSYKKYLDKTRSKNIKSMKKTIRERYGKNVSDADIEELFAIKEQFPELFDDNSTFYQKVLIANKTSNKKGDISFMQIIADTKKELEKSGTPYTIEDLKRISIEKTGNKYDTSYAP